MTLRFDSPELLHLSSIISIEEGNPPHSYWLLLPLLHLPIMT